MKSVFVYFFCIVSTTLVAAQEQFSVYFDSNQFELTAKEKYNLTNWINLNQNVKVVGIHGFTDEDGSSGFNDTLAKNRIAAIFNLIKDKVKIRDDFKTRSFGELHQLSKVKAENRKVTLFYIEAKDLERENEILGIKEVVAIAELKEIIRYPEKLVFDNPDGSKSEYALDVNFMKKIAETPVGEKLKIDNLNFKINTFIVVPESKGKMYELLLVLQKNPKLKIEIQGFGSTHPVFPLPEKDESQRAANRRVEIEIVSN
jgi:outer membrane protein OmpA-like peptidoglycan-associated protein